MFGGLISETIIFLQNTHLSSTAHPFEVDWAVNNVANALNKDNSFSSRTVCLWNNLPGRVFPASYKSKTTFSSPP